MAHRAVLVLSGTPDQEQAEKIAQYVAQEYSDDDQRYIIWYLDDELPPWVTVAQGDQLSAHKRDSGPEACYMAVAMCNDEEIEALHNEEE